GDAAEVPAALPVASAKRKSPAQSPVPAPAEDPTEKENVKLTEGRMLAKALAVDRLLMETKRPRTLMIRGKQSALWLGSFLPPGERVKLPFPVSLPNGRLLGGSLSVHPSQGPTRRLTSLNVQHEVSLNPGAVVLAVAPSGPQNASVEVR